MNLSELREAGAFVEPEPVKVPVTWTRQTADGEKTSKFDIWVRRRAFGLIDKIMASDGDRSRSSQMIAHCVLLGDECEPMTYDEAFSLNPSLAWAMVNAINEASAPKN